jgi:hypothetical protein
MSTFFLCVVAILVSLKVGVIIPFLTASVFAGVAWDAAFTGSMRGLLDKTSLKTGQACFRLFFSYLTVVPQFQT